MKLILAIINNDDAGEVSVALTKSGFTATKLATTGGFLKAGNTTFLIGTQDEKVNVVLSIIADFSQKRQGLVPDGFEYTSGDYMGSLPIPTEVTVGGATVFVMNIERFEKF